MLRYRQHTASTPAADIVRSVGPTSGHQLREAAPAPRSRTKSHTIITKAR
jgi:hypothetical protein